MSPSAFDPAAYNAAHGADHAALRLLGWWPGDVTADPTTPAGVGQVKAWQSRKGLSADGALGPEGWAFLRKLHKPRWGTVPHGRAETEACYGNPVGSVVKGNPVVGRRWLAANVVRVDVGGGRLLPFHKEGAEEFASLTALARQHSGYDPAEVQVGNVRWKRGGDRDPSDPPSLSIHSYYAAFDADPSLNPWGNSPGSPLVRFPLFCAIFRVAGWSCGVDWKTPDTMHLQRSRA